MSTQELTDAELALCRQDDFKEHLTGWVVFAGAMLVLLAVGILVWQAYQWLKHGAWPPLTWATGFDFMGLRYPHTEAVGAQRIIDLFMGLGLWTLPLWSGLVGTWGWFTYADYRSQETKDAIAKRAGWKRHKAWLESQKS